MGDVPKVFIYRFVRREDTNAKWTNSEKLSTIIIMNKGSTSQGRVKSQALQIEKSSRGEVV